MKRMFFKWVAALLCALLLTTACKTPTPSEQIEPTAGETARSTAVPEEPTPEPSEFAALNREARYANDYLFLWETLETDYPFLPYLKDKGIDVDGIRERYAERVNGIEDDETLLMCLKDLFEELNNTAHLSVINPGRYQSLYSIFVLNPQAASQTIYDPWREALTDPALSHIYTPPEEGNYDAYQSEKSGNAPEVGAGWYEDCKTLLLTVPTFSSSTVERDRDVIHDTILAYPEAENIIFDITKNGGGSDAYWIQNIVGRFGESYGFYWREFYRDTPLNRTDVDSRESSQAVSELNDAPEWAIAMGLDRYFSGRQSVAAGGSKPIHSAAKRWVVVDEAVYSSSEKFVIFCKQMGWATVVGRHTGGDGLGFDPVLVMLPDSGILFRFSNTAGETPDGALTVDGTEPDIVLDTEPLSDGLLELIRSGGVN